MTAYKQPFAGRDKENSPPHWRESREKVTSYARLYLNNSDGLMNVSAHWAGTKRAAVFKVS